MSEGGEIRMSEDVNPRGFKRPRDGRGGGVGMPSGLRVGRNTEPCPEGNVGEGRGEGKGKGKNRA